MLSQEECVRLFENLRTLHQTSGEVNAGFFLSKFQREYTGEYTLRYERCNPMKTFREISIMNNDNDVENVMIVCYKTNNGSTHAICWDVRGKRILDSELQNSMTFLYDDFTQTSTGAMAIVNTLSASIDVPCILYIAFWKIRTSKKRKRKN